MRVADLCFVSLQFGIRVRGVCIDTCHSLLCLLNVHLDILCNENQPDPLFIFNLFGQSTSTWFGYVYCPSSGAIHCICTAIGTCCTFKLTGSWSGQVGVP